MTIASKEPKTEEAKTEGELTAAKRLYESVNLQGATVTADALHCEKESMQMVVENGGDFLFQLKKNAPTAFERTSCFDAGAPPLGRGRHPFENPQPQRQPRRPARSPHLAQSPPDPRQVLALYP